MRRLFPLIILLFAISCGKKTDETQVKDVPPEDIPPYGVSAAHPLATEAGFRVLATGGSAVDAAIAVQAVLGLVEPQSSGFGGGAFMMVYDPKTGDMIAWDGRETAPASASPTMFLGEDGTPLPFYDAVTSGKSVGVPGVVAMLDAAHKQYGKLDYGELLAPAHELAVNGFRVTPRLHKLIGQYPRLDDTDIPAAYFFNRNGTPLAVGEILRNPAYARTLEEMADYGADAFYKGEIAGEIIKAVNDHTGEETLTRADFAVYRPVARKPVCTDYRDKKICSMGPPSSGGVTLLQILELLERTNFAALPAQSPEAWHLLMEASRLAYADRNFYLADPVAMQFGEYGADDIVDGLLNPAYIDKRAKEIYPDRSIIKVGPGNPMEFVIGRTKDILAPDTSPELPSTSHFTIVDKDGLVVSMTTSVEFAFGSHLMAGGMILNNQLTDFSFLPEQDGRPAVNAAAADKRPRSSMTPVIILNEDGTLHSAFGSPGGPAIIGYVAKTLVGVLDWGLTLQEAIDLPNIVVPRGGVLVEEDRLDAARLDALAGFGTKTQERELTSGVYGIIVRADRTLEGGVDARREGSFEGFPE